MATFRLAVRMPLSFLVLAFLFTACGGGSSTPPPDTVPEDFTFTAATDQPRSTAVTSSTVTITGLGAASELSVSGGEYAIGAGDFATASTTIANEQTVRVRGQSAEAFAASTTVTLTIGGVSADFVITTEARDDTPDSFNLGVTASASVPDEWFESDTITVSGINVATAIAIENGEFRLVGVDDYPSMVTEVTEGQQVQVRVRSGSAAGQTQTATLSIGGVDGSFAVTTSDTTAPTANVQFPTPNTLSNGTSVTLRGKAMDDFGPVSTINILVTTDDGATEVGSHTLTAEEADDFQVTWSYPVSLATDKVNTLTVTATDHAGNVQSEPQVLTVTQSTTEMNFPVGEDVFIGVYSSRGMGWDQASGRLLLPNATQKIIAVDTSTGDRALFADLTASYDNPNAADVYVLDDENKVLVSDRGVGAIFISDLESPSFGVLSDADTLGSDVVITRPAGMRLHSNGLLYVIDSAEHFYTVDISTGARTLVSDATRPEGGDNLFDGPRGFFLDEPNNRALVSDSQADQLLWVDLESGMRSVLPTEVTLIEPWFVEKFGDGAEAVVLDRDTSTQPGVGALVLVDTDTGEASILSDNSVPNANNSLGLPTSLIVDREKNIAYVGSNKQLFVATSFVNVVDLTTGERITLTYSLPSPM